MAPALAPIPVSSIERIEVLKDGGLSIYGAEANAYLVESDKNDGKKQSHERL